MTDWLIDEDEEFLLSMLAAWDHTAQELSTNTQCTTHTETERLPLQSASVKGESVTGHAPIPKTTTTQHTRVNHSRERRKQEIHQLRDEAQALQDQLVALQRRREEMLQPHFLQSIGRRHDAILSTAPIWESLSRRQFQARRQSEQYNAKLRSMVRDQVRVTKDLLCAIQKVVQQQQQQGHLLLESRLPMDVTQRMTEEEQLQRLHVNCAQWQWALWSLSPKFQHGLLRFLDFHVPRVTTWSGDGGTDCRTAMLDVYSSNVLPFSVATVAHVMWSFFQDETGSENPVEVMNGEAYVQDHRTLDDLIIATFTSTSTMGGATSTRGTMQGKWVAKRMAGTDDPSQRLIVSNWYYELTGFKNELDGVCVTEDGWLRLVDANELGQSHLTGPVTAVQHVRRLRIDRSGQSDSAQVVDSVTEMFIQQIRSEIKWVDQAIENLLLSGASSSAE